MKNIILILIIFLAISKIMAFDQDTHKYLTIQAWELVRHQYPEVIGSEMDIAMRRGYAYNWEGYNWGPWTQKCIVNGSYREDEEDPAFHEENRILDCFFGTATHVFQTSNHFWNPDLGFNHHPSFETCCGTYGYFNNANEKLIAYGSGLSRTWTLNYKYNVPWGPYTMQYNGQTVQALLGISYYGIDNALQGQMYVPMIYVWTRYNIGGHYIWMYVRHDINTPVPLSNYITSPTDREEIRQRIVWETIGRMSHLIEDMGVPAHAHDDPHPRPPQFGGICDDPDFYEHFIIPNHRTDKGFMDAYNEGGLVNYSSSWDPTSVACFSNYIINQVSDRFASSDYDGDVYYNSDPIYANVLAPIYQSIGNVSTEYPATHADLDVLFAHNYTHIIKRLAGFYWHLFNYSSMQPGIPYDLTLSNRDLQSGINYRAYHNITLDHVNTSYGGNSFIAGNGISILESSIKPAPNTSFQIQTLDYVNNDTLKKYLFDDEEVLEVDSNYSQRELYSNITPFRNYEIENLDNSKSFRKEDTNLKKSGDKNDKKETTRTKTGVIGQGQLNAIDPGSELGILISSLMDTAQFEDVTNIVLMLDTIKSIYDTTSLLQKDKKTTLNNMPDRFSLSQNYPNPFNPSTSIKYALKENVYVKIVVYDILGRVVRTIVNDYQEAGYKSVVWDGTNDNNKPVASGIYFYKIVAGSFTDAKKMLLIK